MIDIFTAVVLHVFECFGTSYSNLVYYYSPFGNSLYKIEFYTELCTYYAHVICIAKVNIVCVRACVRVCVYIYLYLLLCHMFLLNHIFSNIEFICYNHHIYACVCACLRVCLYTFIYTTLSHVFVKPYF